MNSAEPTQKVPDTIWIILKLMNSMFNSVDLLHIVLRLCGQAVGGRCQTWWGPCPGILVIAIPAQRHPCPAQGTVNIAQGRQTRQ